MSTDVDMDANRATAKPSKKRKIARSAGLKDAEATRNRILAAAKIHFSQMSYEAVGLREIARDAEADPALAIRYFGSKEKLFREVAESAFASVDILQGSTALLRERILQELLHSDKNRDWRQGYDPFRLLLCSIGSEVAGPIVSQVFHRSFVEMLAASLTGQCKVARAALTASYILGIALLRVTEPQTTFEGNSGKWIGEQLSEALDRCLAPHPAPRRAGEPRG